ncbi:hypothetical protein QEN19_003855 [Hanseniaspora menglaensis]
METRYTKRLQTEFYSLLTSTPPPGISAFPSAEDSLAHWTAVIEGPSSTPYEHMKFKVFLIFPPSYPYSPPTVKFVTKIFHPNIDSKGNVCLDILKDKWSPVFNIQTILISLQVLLGEPNNASPLNWIAADLWEKPLEYQYKVSEIYDFVEDKIISSDDEDKSDLENSDNEEQIYLVNK